MSGGVEAIRRAMLHRVKSHKGWGKLSREVHIPNDGLRAFAEGADNLNDEALSVVAGYLWDKDYDPVRDVIVRGTARRRSLRA